MSFDFSDFTIWFNGILVAIIVFVAKEVGGYVGAIIKSNKSFESKLTSVRNSVTDLGEKVFGLYGEQIKHHKKMAEEVHKVRESVVRFEMAKRKRKDKEVSELREAIKMHHQAHRLTLKLIEVQKAEVASVKSHLVKINDDLVMVKSKTKTHGGGKNGND